MPALRSLAVVALAVLALAIFASNANAAGRKHKPAPTPPPSASASASEGSPPSEVTEVPAACIGRTKAELASGESSATRLDLARCERAAGSLIEGLRDADRALKDALERHDVPAMKEARKVVEEISPKIPHVTFAAPSEATEMTVTFDERPVPIDSLGKKFAVNPGTHVAHAEGTVNGISLAFDKEYEIKEGDLTVIAVVMTPAKPEFLTQGQLQCMLSAKNQEDVLKCLPENRKNLVVKAGFDMSAYSDTDHVHVFSPSVNGSVSSPTAGWNVGGSYLVDVVSAASPDIVSEASPPFHEVRHAGSLTGGYKPGIFGVQANVDLSSEPDYLALGGGLAMLAELHDKLITPRVAWNYGHDTIGRSTTPFNVFHHTLSTNEFEAGTTFVLSSRSVLLLNGTLQLERGDQSKPYRYVPMFEPAVAPTVKPGQSIDSVNSARINVRPLEQLPTERNRYALGLRFAHRFSGSTLRLEERLYYDSWQQAATTTDMRFVVDVGDRFRFWPHGRLNLQNGADFYKLAYSAIVDPTSHQVTLPAYRTDDRELSPLLTVTGGAGLRFSLSSAQATHQYGISVQGDAMFTRFFDALFLINRTAYYGTVGFDAEFD